MFLKVFFHSPDVVLENSSMIICACLVAETAEAILLIRAQGKELWYLPGGKIEAGESPEQALCRELQEEIGVTLAPADCSYFKTITGPSHDGRDMVKLICYKAPLPLGLIPAAEIAQLGWISKRDLHLMAPAVRLLVKDQPCQP